MLKTKSTLQQDPNELNADLPRELVERFRDRFDPSRVPENAYHDPNGVILCVHIPKTAGISVGAALREAVEHFYGIDWKNVALSFQNRTNQACYRRTHTPGRHVIMGHFSWEEMAAWKVNSLPFQGASFIRDPIARAISNFNYNASDVHPARDTFLERFPTIEAYVKSLSFDFQLTKMIGQFYSFEQALQKLIENYTFIGITENLNASLVHLARSHGLASLTERRENTGTVHARTPQVSDEVRRIIKNRSHNDLRFHALVKTLFQTGKA